jgi:hypothetical protein
MNVGNHSGRAARPAGRCPSEERSGVRQADAVRYEHGIGRRAREDRCSPRSVMRGTVRMTARSLRPSRTGTRVVTTRAPMVLVAPAGARSSRPRAVPLSFLMSRCIARLPAPSALCAMTETRCLHRRRRLVGCPEGDRDEQGARTQSESMPRFAGCLLPCPLRRRG